MESDTKKTTSIELHEDVDSALDTMLDQVSTVGNVEVHGGCLLGEVLDDRHPTLSGRVLMRWGTPSGDRERWLPTLQGLSLRSGDRALLMRPANGTEPIVIGVVDGFAKRPEPQRTTAATIELRRDEAVRVAGVDGQQLLEIHQSENGPVVRLLQNDVDLEIPGKLRVRAKALDLRAEQGPANITATDDVVVKGEVIRLN